MNLFNLICIEKKHNNSDLILALVIAISLFALIYGIMQLCENFRKKDELSKKNIKKGLISFISSIVIIFLSILLMASDASNFVDACHNTSIPLRIIKALCYCLRVIFPISIIIKIIIEIILNMIRHKKDDTNKKLLKQRIIRDIAALLIIFIIITCIIFYIDAVVKVPESSSYYTCWC